MNDNLEHNLEMLSHIRQQIKALSKEEQELRYQIHEAMTARNTNVLETPRFICIRNVRGREIMSRRDIPPDVWQAYAHDIEYSTLQVTRRH